MKRFIEGADRGQSTLFPECVEDWIGEDNPVRLIDVFVDELDLAELGFGGIDPEVTGRRWSKRPPRNCSAAHIDVGLDLPLRFSSSWS